MFVIDKILKMKKDIVSHALIQRITNKPGVIDIRNLTFRQSTKLSIKEKLSASKVPKKILQ